MRLACVWWRWRKSNPRSLKCFESFRDYGVRIGVQRCTVSRSYWKFFWEEREGPFMGSEFPFYSKIVVLLKPCLNSINSTINLKCAVFQNSASRGRSGFEFSSKSLSGRTRRFIFYRWLGIRIKWTKVKQLILEEHLDEGKSAVEFRKWQESLQDPKSGNQQDEPVATFRDLRERMEMIETG